MSCKDISIIVPAVKYNQWLLNLFNSIRDQSCEPGELILVWDGPDPPISLSLPVPGKIIINHPSEGAAAARNAGAQAASCPWLLFLDADVIAPPELVKMAAELVERKDGVVAWIGSYDNAPTEKNFFSRYKNLQNHFIHQQALSEASTFWGACGLISKKIFDAMGGFDEKYLKATVEDIELGYRLGEKGFSIRLEKDFQVKHQKKWTFGSLLRSDIFDRAIPWTRLMWRYRYLGKNDLNLKAYARWSFLFVVLLLLSIAATFILLPAGLAGILVCIVALILLNRKLYAFYARQGMGFLLGAIGMNWLYYLYSGLSFIYATVSYSIFGKER